MGQARYRFTTRADGDLAPGSVGVDQRRRAVIDRSWTWLRQVHGSGVVVVERPGEHAGAQADAAVTASPGAALAVQAADCAPVALLGDGAVGVAHAGWRGLMEGVVPAAVEALRRLRPGPVRAVLGPCIRTPCYPFSPLDLDAVAATVGDDVRGRTLDGRPALDLPGGVRAALAGAGVVECHDTDVCTACSSHHWSHRRDAAPARQALVAWLDH